MQKVVKINSKTSIKLDANFGWLYTYRNQFGTDLAPKLIPVLQAATALMAELAKATKDDTNALEVIKAIPPEDLQDAIIELSGLELVDIINIIWCLAKTADETIDPPEIWVRQFDVFPLNVLLPEVVTLVARSSWSAKNWKGLTAATKQAAGPEN